MGCACGFEVQSVFRVFNAMSSLSLKMLTFKTVIALATASRAQTIISMNLDLVVLEKHAVVFFFPNIL